MDKFKFGVFDIFVYSLPGIVVLTSLTGLFIEFDKSVPITIGKFIETVNKLTFSSSVLVLISSYILGFVLHFFGYNYFYQVGARLWKNELKGYRKGLSTMEKMYVKVRQYGKENFQYVELWSAFRAMSFNLSLSTLFLTLVILYQMIQNSLYSLSWFGFIVGGILTSIISLRRAVTFHQWSHRTLKETHDIIESTNSIK